MPGNTYVCAYCYTRNPKLCSSCERRCISGKTEQCKGYNGLCEECNEEERIRSSSNDSNDSPTDPYYPGDHAFPDHHENKERDGDDSHDGDREEEGDGDHDGGDNGDDGSDGDD